MILHQKASIRIFFLIIGNITMQFDLKTNHTTPKIIDVTNNILMSG